MKYPRTPHLPWSIGRDDDDVIMFDIANFIGKQIVVTEKCDGENTGMDPNTTHARSLDSRHHPSRSWVKQLHSKVKHNIPEGYKLFGENLYAKHSIFYSSLPTYFMVFAAFNNGKCLSWEDTVELATLLDLQVVPILYQGEWNEEKVKNCWTGISKFGGEQEGYVIRVADEFLAEDFEKFVGKFVRKNHVKTDQHWMKSEIVPNGLV